MKRKSIAQNVVGIVPMAGLAERLGKLGCSKEIYPVRNTSFAVSGKDTSVICEHILDKMRRGGIERIYITLRDGKWDIPAYLGDGSNQGVHLAYLMMGLPYGTPYSIDQAFPFVSDSIVALGFPDMAFGDEDIFTRLLTCLDTMNADVVLGIFPADRPQKTDMVDITADGVVRQIVIKPIQTDLKNTWGIAGWKPVFTHFMHKYLQQHQSIAATSPELFIGDVIQAGLESGLCVRAVRVSDRPFLDIGTRDDLERLESSVN